MTVRLSLPSALLAAMLLAAPAGAQAPSASPAAPSFPAGTELVTVDAVVVDKKGDPITGLTAADFQLLEDGKPQRIQSFEAVVLPEQPPTGPAPEKPRLSTNQDPEARLGRTFVLVFDDIHMSAGQADRAKSALVEFLKSGVREGDRVSLVATSGAAWWSTRMTAGRDELVSMVGRLDGRYVPDRSPDRMTEFEAMRVHVYRDPQISERVSKRFQQYGKGAGSETAYAPEDDPMVRSRAAEVYWQSVSRNRLTLQVLTRVLESLAATKGRKSLVLVSEGFIYDPNLDEFKDVVQTSRRSNVAIFFLDTKGLGGLPPYMSAEYSGMADLTDLAGSFSDVFEASAGAEEMANASGGFVVKNTNDFARGIQRIAAETRAYYMIGYTPANATQDGRFRKIELKTRTRGAKVRARKGYFAPLPGGAAPKPKEERGADPDIQSALDSPYEMRQVPIRMTSWVFDETMLGRATTVVAADVDIRKFAFEDENGRATDAAEFLLVVAHRETGEFFRYDQKIEMKLSPETRARLDRTWLPIVRDFELAAGGYQAKIVVRDANSKAIGTVVHEFEVPALDTLRVSTPILTDVLQEGEAPAEGPRRPSLVARRTFAAGKLLYAQFEVYNAKKNDKGMPVVTAGYVIRRVDTGEELVKVAPTEIRPTSLGRISRLVGSPLPPGIATDMELVLTVTDTLDGKSLEIREKFQTEIPAPAAP